MRADANQRAARLELTVLRWLADAPCGLTYAELRARLGDAAKLLPDALVRLAGQVCRYPGCIYSITSFGRERMGRESVLLV